MHILVHLRAFYDLTSACNRCAHYIKFTMTRILTLAVTVLLASLQAGCSPYLYSEQIKTLGGKASSLKEVYTTTLKNLENDQYQKDRSDWLLSGNGVKGSDACQDPTHEKIGPCRLQTFDLSGDQCKNKALKPPDNFNPSTSDDQQSVQGFFNDHAHLELLKTANKSALLAIFKTDNLNSIDPDQVSGKLAELTNLQFRALERYTESLVAITNAQDRVAFDSAASKASTAIGALATSAGMASGIGAAAAPAIGTVAKATSSGLFWLIGQGLDRQRLEQLRLSTREAHPIIVKLADILGKDILAPAYNDRLNILSNLLSNRVSMINGVICRNKLAGRPIDDSQWFSGLGSMMDQAKAATEVIEMVRKSNPEQTTNALVAAHEELKKPRKEMMGN